MKVSLVPFDEIGNVWPKAFPYVLKSIEAGGNRDHINDILEGLLPDDTGHVRYTLWIAFDDDFEVRAAMIIEKIVYPQDTVLFLRHVGGEEGMSWFLKMYKALNSYAFDIGCDYFESYSIPRMESFMKRCGAEEQFRIYRLPVKEK